MLAPGYHLYRGPDGFWRCYGPDDRVLRIRSEQPPTPEELGLLAEEHDPVPLGDRVVHVEGDNPVADQVVELLQPHVKVIRGVLQSAAGVDLVIACAGWLPDARWLDLDRICGEVPWHRCHAEGTRFFLGPCTKSYAEVRARRLAAARLPEETLAHWRHLETADELPPVPWPSPGGVAVIAGLLVDDVLAHLSGQPVPSGDCQLAVAGAEITRHPVAGLVDRRLGLITRVEEQPSALRACVVHRAYVADTRHFASWRADRVAGGAALFDHDRARQAAIGEAMERYCGNAVPETLLRSAYRELEDPAVDPLRFALYSAQQYAAKGFPFVPMTREQEIEWTAGQDLATGQDVLVPASLVYLNYRRPPHTNFHVNAGVAAGRSRAQAERSALLEVLERDAVTRWWMSGEPAAGIEPPPDDALTRALAEATALGWRVTFLSIPSQVPVIGAFVEHDGIVAFGTACRTTAEAAAAKAFTEAVVSYTMSLGLLDPATWNAVDHPYRPFRPDRAYRDDFRPDWQDLTDLELNLQLFLDPRMQGPLLDRLRNPPPSAPPPPGEPNVAGAISVDLTLPEVRAAGLHVVRVIVPGMYSNAPAAFPFLGGTRLGEVAVLDPLPFA
ncbi:YcaO-like family protein [Nonomuraea fuscirosea]|uniref:YcaO-like family protein n=1 Tax=Nonomuraea fuscirosea TaxID=1291556 RepID=UPI002DD7D87C|nr:YcaO-like family protein [Nonomuraea fuscirosea]WSA51017.1 YcaO-like family protein [Nonomuraea fuscirosea]